MRYSILVIVFSYFMRSALAAAGEPLTPRPLDAFSVATFDSAMQRSAIVRSLVSTLEASNVIVHIESSRVLPFGIGGMTRFVTATGGFRYVRVTLHADLPPKARVSTLAHELQHACEIALSGAEDVESLRHLFEHAGHRSGDFYETAAAVETERHVQIEQRGIRNGQNTRNASLRIQ